MKMSGIRRRKEENAVPPASAGVKNQFGGRAKLGTVRHHFFIAWNSSYCTGREA